MKNGSWSIVKKFFKIQKSALTKRNNITMFPRRLSCMLIYCFVVILSLSLTQLVGIIVINLARQERYCKSKEYSRMNLNGDVCILWYSKQDNVAICIPNQPQPSIWLQFLQLSFWIHPPWWLLWTGQWHRKVILSFLSE